MALLRDLRPPASTIALGLLLSLATDSPAAAQAPPSPSAPSQAVEGRRLFEGRVAFQNGGPACAACHTISTVPFPNGGTVGPDLSGAWEKFGPDGMQPILQTLFFPTMLPQYQDRALTAAEQQALAAFFAQAKGVSGRDRDTAVLGALALAGFLVLIAASGLLSRGRLRGVRAPLLARAQPRGARP